MQDADRVAPPYRNTLLNSLDSDIIARLRLVAAGFKVGHKIEQPGSRVRNLVFLETGMASMTTSFVDGSQVEVGMFGNEAVIGVFALMGADQSLHNVYMQVEGTGYRCSYAAAREEFGRFELFHNLCLRYAQSQLLQSTQAAGCAAKHTNEQRLSRWLLTCADRAGVETFKMSQDFLSQMLGSTRPTVSLVAGTLKKEELIDYTRGVISIQNRKELEGRSCECYRVIRDHVARYEQLHTPNTA